MTEEKTKKLEREDNKFNSVIDGDALLKLDLVDYTIFAENLNDDSFFQFDYFELKRTLSGLSQSSYDKILWLLHIRKPAVVDMKTGKVRRVRSRDPKPIEDELLDSVYKKFDKNNQTDVKSRVINSMNAATAEAIEINKAFSIIDNEDK